MNKQRYIKVPEGIIAKANEQGLISQLQFYYELKAARVDGYFINILQAVDYSQSYIYKNIDKLLVLGWIRKEGTNYQLVKYDDLFKYFNYDLMLKLKNKTIRRGNFKIFKISVDKLKEFIIYIAYEEIKLNFARQKYAIKQKLDSLKQKNSILEEQFKEQLSVRGISRILGFSSKSPASGYRIRKRLEELGLITVKQHRDSNGLPLCGQISFSS